MKKILFLLAILVVLGSSARVNAQCDLEFNNLVIQHVSSEPYPDPLGSQCKTVFNASFDITTNSGFKYLFFHSWLVADYPGTPIFDCTGSSPAVDPGTSLQLGTAVDEAGKSFLDIGFVGLREFLATVAEEVPTDITSLFATTYFHDNTVVLTSPANSPGLTAIVTKKPNGVLHFDVTNITIIINQACGGPLGVKTDIWGSNSNAGDPKAQCYICGLQQFFNDPVISGFKTCDSPDRRYTLGVTTTQPGTFAITIKIFADLDDDGIIDDDGDNTFNEAGEDIMVLGSPINHNLSTATPYSSGGPVSYPPYSSQPGVGDKDLLVLVESPSLTNSIKAEFVQPPGCIGLPAEFKTFTAERRSRTNVALKWETLFEQNVSGFTVERRTSGDWQAMGFVPSQAAGGNSTELLAYTFNDPNSLKGISQYRIRQEDLDGRYQYSVTRAVRGEGQSGQTIVYPNPSADGKVTVVFEDGSLPKDLSLLDVNGRVIRQWKSITNNNIQVDNLPTGMFTLRIFVPVTGEQEVQKIIVKRR